MLPASRSWARARRDDRRLPTASGGPADPGVRSSRSRRGPLLERAGLAGGQAGEHGGEFVDTRHVRLRVLAEELGLELDDLWAAWDAATTWLDYVDGRLVDGGRQFDEMAPAVDEVVGWRGRDPSSRARRPPRSARSTSRPRPSGTPNTSAPPAGALPDVEPAPGGMVRARSRSASAVNLIDFYAIDYPGGDERYTIRGGNDQVPSRILDATPRRHRDTRSAAGGRDRPRRRHHRAPIRRSGARHRRPRDPHAALHHAARRGPHRGGPARRIGCVVLDGLGMGTTRRSCCSSTARSSPGSAIGAAV